MARDVADIKKILESLQGPPPVGPAEGRVDTLGAPERGNARATVAIVEFSDYQCPFCKRHVDATLPLIEKNYVTSGKVRYVFMDYPLEAIHPLAFKAAEASHCAAEQKQFWKMHDRLFANQDKLKPDQLMAHATALGLDSARFGTCLASGKYAARIKASLAQGEKFGISGTPAIVLGRNRNGSIEAARLIVGCASVRGYQGRSGQVAGRVPQGQIVGGRLLLTPRSAHGPVRASPTPGDRQLIERKWRRVLIGPSRS
jgi:protein-disulfide isomerase